MATAKKYWEKLAADGRPERGIATLVAKRMGLSSRTISEYRKANWDLETIRQIRAAKRKRAMQD